MLFKTNQIMFYVIIPRSLKIYYCMVNAMNNFNTNDNDLIEKCIILFDKIIRVVYYNHITFHVLTYGI